MHRVATAAALLLVLALAACGEKQIDPDATENFVVDTVNRQTGFRPTDVSCPSDIEAKEGKTFDCEFTGPEGPYVAHMRVIRVDGETVFYALKSERAPS